MNRKIDFASPKSFSLQLAKKVFWVPIQDTGIARHNWERIIQIAQLIAEQQKNIICTVADALST